MSTYSSRQNKINQYHGSCSPWAEGHVGYFNYAYARTGTLFEGRFRSSLVQNNEYFLSCLRYIELNPVRAGMVNDPGDYRWSSYRVHGFGLRSRMWAPHDNYLAFGRQREGSAKRIPRHNERGIEH